VAGRARKTRFKASEGMKMAAELDHVKEMKAHEGTYGLFKGMMKWGTIVAAIITLIVILLIT
jgi:hypothetical protein